MTGRTELGEQVPLIGTRETMRVKNHEKRDSSSIVTPQQGIQRYRASPRVGDMRQENKSKDTPADGVV